MTITYDPTHELYTDQADARREFARVADVCATCRRCVELCSSFPTLFDMLDQLSNADTPNNAGAVAIGGAGAMTPAQQDEVVDACFQCTLCHTTCPYAPAVHEAQVDFPRAVLRMRAMQYTNRINTSRSRRAERFIGSAGTVGGLATANAVSTLVVNALITAAPGSMRRRILSSVTGVSAARRLAPFTRQRFSAWLDDHVSGARGLPGQVVSVFPTCVVEYQHPAIGRAIVGVFEHNGVECTNSAAQCCGAPLLQSGDIRRFAKVAAKNVSVLAREVRSGRAIIVAQPGCCDVIRSHYVDHVSGETAGLVAANTFQPAEYVLTQATGRHAAAGPVSPSTEFGGAVVDRITLHVGPNAAATQSRDLLRLTGAEVSVVAASAAVDGLWGLRAANDAHEKRMAARMMALIQAAGEEVTAGDCQLTNDIIADQSAQPVFHPMQILAIAYGIADDV